MNKRLRLILIATAVPVALVALISTLGGNGGAKGGPVVVVKSGGSGATGTARPSSTAVGLTLEDLLKNGGGSTKPSTEVVTPTMPPADPKVVADLMDKGERAYTSGDLAMSRGYFDRASKMDPTCVRCKEKLDLLEQKMLKEIQDAFRAGDGYLQDGRWDQAIWSYERVFAMDPDPKSQYHENANTLIEEAKAKKKENSR